MAKAKRKSDGAVLYGNVGQLWSVYFASSIHSIAPRQTWKPIPECSSMKNFSVFVPAGTPKCTYLSLMMQLTIRSTVCLVQGFLYVALLCSIIQSVFLFHYVRFPVCIFHSFLINFLGLHTTREKYLYRMHTIHKSCHICKVYEKNGKKENIITISSMIW